MIEISFLRPFLAAPALVALCSAPACLAGVTSSPTGPDSAAGGDAWWRISPYGWVPAVTGDAAWFGQPVEVDRSMGDTWADQEFSAMLALEAGKGRWSFGIDGLYSRFSDSGAAPVPGFTRGGIEVEQFYGHAYVGCDLLRDERTTVTLTAGARYTHVSTAISLVHPLAGALAMDHDAGWWDPVAGLAVSVQLDERWSLRFDGDIGASLGGSDLIWQAELGLGRRLVSGLSGRCGYRVFGVDHRERDFSMDVVSHGPFAGLVCEF